MSGIPRIYLYPNIDYKAAKSPNPYIFNFEKSLQQHYQVVNRRFNKKGVLEFFQYLTEADLYVLHWIEDLPIYRLGKFQVILFCCFLLLTRLFRKKILWVLHNKYSHYIGRNFWTDTMYALLMKYSDVILTHSSAGIEFVKEFFPAQTSKVHYLVHPVQTPFPLGENPEKKYDFLIWGTIFPYKGIVKLLQFLKEPPGNQEVKILIVGQCPDDSYKAQLRSLTSGNIIFEDSFYSLEEIARLANQSKFILFTYNSKTVLSSGVLMDSIRMGASILGPDHGAFKDLKSWSFIDTYQDFDQILTLLNHHYSEECRRKDDIEKFCQEYSWGAFGDKVKTLIDPLFSAREQTFLAKKIHNTE